MYEKAGFRVICHGYRGFWWRDHNRTSSTTSSPNCADTGG